MFVGILVSRFQIFNQTMQCSYSTVEMIVRATVCLHNMLMKHSIMGEDDFYTPDAYKAGGHPEPPQSIYKQNAFLDGSQVHSYR